MKLSINSPVGNNSRNNQGDVMIVQRLINSNLPKMLPFLSLKVDGDCGPITIGMIKEFQYRILGSKRPDGVVDPGKKTLEALNEYTQKSIKSSSIMKFDDMLLQVQSFFKGHNAPDPVKETSKKITEADYVRAATILGVDVASIKAVARVESSGNGFLASGKPKILFEGHWFSKLTKAKHDKAQPTISFKSSTPKFYKGGEKEYLRYNTARALDATAAMQAASWGKFQIMGFNYKAAGYATVQDFVKAMHVSEGQHLLAFVNLVKSKKWDAPLKSKDWAGFARLYNGPNYAVNKYDTRLKQAYKAFSAGGK